MLRLILRALAACTVAIVPFAATAATNCKIVDFEDHVELVCIGDEKSDPSQSSAQKSMTVQPQPIPQASPHGKSIMDSPARVPDNSSAIQEPVHRQGRQQYQKSLKDAKDSRSQIITEQELNKPYQPPVPAPLLPKTDE